MKSIILTLLISITSLTLLIAQNTTASESGNQISLGAAVNIAGKQRMLTQRMAKDFVYIGMNIHTELATRERASSIILFEENFKVLSGFAPSEKIKVHLIKEEVLWKEYKKLIIAETTKDNAALILEKNTAVLTACDELVKAYVEYAGTLPKQPNSEGATILSIAENTNTAGRQRMLSQRLTFYYAAYVWGITEQFPTEKIKSFAEFIQQNFSKLIISEVNTTDIDDALANVIADWREVEERCTKDNCYTFENKGMDVAQMFKVTSNILQKMDKITGMYAKLLE